MSTLSSGTRYSIVAETRARHANWLLALQREDGGFAGREGDSDLYYTSFGLRGLSMLGELNGEPAERAAAFLLGKLASQQTIIDFLSLIYAGFLLDTSAGIDIFAAQDILIPYSLDPLQESVASVC